MKQIPTWHVFIKEKDNLVYFVNLFNFGHMAKGQPRE